LDISFASQSSKEVQLIKITASAQIFQEIFPVTPPCLFVMQLAVRAPLKWVKLLIYLVKKWRG